MSVFLSGKSTRLICNKIIEKTDDAVMFPAFLKKSHRLHRYSDSNMHKRCFEASPDKEELQRLFTRFREIWESRPKDLRALKDIEEWGKSAFSEFDES